ncbi:MAG: hypothetical protein FJZ15_07850, partial [Candidatus Omnitrophica bacterium]|nr:hypothetical protein [Candidatus Omnitrophota bacterium]
MINSQSIFGFRVFALLLSLFIFACPCFAQDRPSSGELITKAWAAQGNNDIEAVLKFTQECIDLYKDEADKQQASLKAMPTGRNEIEAVQSLNDVATAYFIRAETYRAQGNTEEARKNFDIVKNKYKFAQAWDPRGWFWSLAKAADGPVEPPPEKKYGPPTKVVLYDPGKEDFVDYPKYGEFQNIGTKDYKYIIKDQEGLSAAVGEGIYPNTTSIR